MSSQDATTEPMIAPTRPDARAAVVAAVTTIAPEHDDEDLTDDARLREDLDLDSMDVLDVMTELGRRTGVGVPEADMARLRTIGDCVAYLGEHTAGT